MSTRRQCLVATGVISLTLGRQKRECHTQEYLYTTRSSVLARSEVMRTTSNDWNRACRESGYSKQVRLHSDRVGSSTTSHTSSRFAHINEPTPFFFPKPPCSLTTSITIAPHRLQRPVPSLSTRRPHRAYRFNRSARCCHRRKGSCQGE